MALLECPTHLHIPALLRQGFAARLRSETADIYLSQREDSVILTTSRSKASVLFFCGGDGPLSAILIRPPENGEPRFLSVAENVEITDSPTLLKLTLSDPGRQLFSISRVAPTAYLSLHHVSTSSSVTTRSVLSKWELFHLEVIPATIGKGFVPGPFPNTKYIKPSQAVSHALLELGVRFRLRSVHGRVLRKINDQIRQDGPKTQIASTFDEELLFTAFRLAKSDTDAYYAEYALKDVDSGRYLILTKSGVKLGTDSKTICVRASPNGWGMICLGIYESNQYQWLMAGPRGRLEMRHSPGAWETYSLELVRQSYDATIRELSVPGIYKVAEAATRQNLRQQVEARVAQARQIQQAPNVKSVSKNKFDHSKALAGLSDPTSTALKKVRQGKNEVATRNSPKDDSTKSAKGAKGAKKITPVSGLPRNKANKKASKKNRKRQKQNAKSRVDSATVTPKKGSASTSKPTPKVESNNSKSETDSKSDSTPSSAVTAEAGARGPPCAACGRPLVGTYTTALGKSFHRECFCCGRCRRPMSAGAGQFRERGGIPYCSSCYATHLASRCARCSQPIMETVVTAMEKTWHKDCLTCTICRLPLTQTFWLYADKPNEPRCSRCVTGDENYTSSRGSRRMVNLPGFGRPKNTPSPPLGGLAGASGSGSNQSGRARFMAPALPPMTRR